jgi:hypothetical protein
VKPPPPPPPPPPPTATVEKPRKAFFGAGAGVAVIDFGCSAGSACPSVPAQLAVQIGGAYILHFTPKLSLNVGGVGIFTPIPYEKADTSSATANFITLGARGEVVFDLGHHLDVRGGMSLGVSLLTSLADGNPLTDNQMSAGALAMFNFGLGAALDYNINGLVLSLAPANLLYSPPAAKLAKDFSRLMSFDILVGLGYSL